MSENCVKCNAEFKDGKAVMLDNMLFCKDCAVEKYREKHPIIPGKGRIFNWTESPDGERLTVSLTSNPEKTAVFDVKNILPVTFRSYWEEMKADDVFQNAMIFVLKQKASDSSVTGKTAEEKFNLVVETATRLTSDDTNRTFNGIRTGNTAKKVVKVGIADVSAKAAQLDPAELEQAIAAAKLLGIDLSAILGK